MKFKRAVKILFLSLLCCLFINNIIFAYEPSSVQYIDGTWEAFGNGYKFKLTDGSYFNSTGSSVAGITYNNQLKYYIFYMGYLIDPMDGFDSSTDPILVNYMNELDSVNSHNVNSFNNIYSQIISRDNNNTNSLDTNQGVTSSTLADSINAEGINPIKPFSEMDGSGGDPLGGEGYQFDLFGIYMSNPVENYYGNTAFLANTDQINTFKELLKELKYKFDLWDEFIKAIKEKFHIITKSLTIKPNMDIKEKENRARIQREEVVNRSRFLNYFNVLLRTLGIVLIGYGVLIALCGVVDEAGITSKFLTSIVTGGKITPGVMVTGSGNPMKTFRGIYIATAFLTILFGVVCLSPTLQKYIYSGISWIFNMVASIFYGGGNVVDKESIHILQ